MMDPNSVSPLDIIHDTPSNNSKQTYTINYIALHPPPIPNKDLSTIRHNLITKILDIDSILLESAFYTSISSSLLLFSLTLFSLNQLKIAFGMMAQWDIRAGVEFLFDGCGVAKDLFINHGEAARKLLKLVAEPFVAQYRDFDVNDKK